MQTRVHPARKNVEAADLYFQRIQIENYRLCRNCTFTPDRTLNALIGPNSSGKTTVLRAIHLLKQLSDQEPFHLGHRPDDDTLAPARIKVSINVQGQTIVHTSDLELQTDESNNDQVVKSTQRWHMRGVTGGRRFKMPLSLAIEPRYYKPYFYRAGRELYFPKQFSPATVDLAMLSHEKAMQAVATVAKFYQQITYYSASQFTNPSKCPVSFEMDEEMKPVPSYALRDTHARWLKDMYVESKQPTREFTQYKDIIGPNGIGLVDRIEFQEIETSIKQVRVRIGGKLQEKQTQTHLIIPKFHIGSSVVSPTQLSEGTFKTLAMVFYLMTARSKVVLLEEPEVCIHQGLLSSLIALIKQYSKEKQVFISTHSDYILDELQQANVFVVHNDRTEGITIRPLRKWIPKEDAGALRQYLATEGSLGEYWRSGGFDDTNQD